MDIKQIKELMAAMEKAGMKRVRVKDEKGVEIELERNDESPSMTVVQVPQPHHHHIPHAPIPHAPTPIAHKAEETKPGKFITSPMVGTFYSAASPDDPIFVKVGDRVEEDTVVCIIEAMKVMNEVKAGMKGQIAEILVDNSHPVEFGTKLFRIQ